MENDNNSRIQKSIEESLLRKRRNLAKKNKDDTTKKDKKAKKQEETPSFSESSQTNPIEEETPCSPVTEDPVVENDILDEDYEVSQDDNRPLEDFLDNYPNKETYDFVEEEDLSVLEPTDKKKCPCACLGHCICRMTKFFLLVLFIFFLLLFIYTLLTMGSEEKAICSQDWSSCVSGLYDKMMSLLSWQYATTSPKALPNAL